MKLHSFSGIGFLPIGVPLDIWTAIAATILKYFWQTTIFFWLKTQKVVKRLFLSQKKFPPKRSSAHAESTGKRATAKFFNKRPESFHSTSKNNFGKSFLFQKNIFFRKKTLYICELQLQLLCQKYTSRNPSCLRSISKQTNEHILYSKKIFFRMVLWIRGRHFRQSCAKFLLTKS